MPADLIGTNVVVETAEGRKQFEFQPGPIFGNILLADEINRATPKTQSALLEAMQEHSVTVAGHTHRLSEPFFVMATQNPLEMEGTYPLPEAQLDRFFCKLLVKFPEIGELESIMDRTTEAVHPKAEPVLAGERILEMSQLARQVPIASEVRRYGLSLVLATHPAGEGSSAVARKLVRYGASPRAIQTLVLAGKVNAIMSGRYNVSFDDLRRVVLPALRHRVVLNVEAQLQNVDADTVLSTILEEVKA